MAYRIQFRRDTTANWTSINPILLQGEFAYSLDTGFAKIGDGSSTWSQLTYFGGTGPTGPGVAISGPTGYTFTTGATGIGFTGGGISAITAVGDFVTVTVGGVSVLGPTGYTFTTGVTGIGFTGGGISSITTVGDFVTVSIGGGTAAQKTANYTISLSDSNGSIEMSSASTTTVTVPLNSSVPFLPGVSVQILRGGTGEVGITGASGTTLRSPQNFLNLNYQYSTAILTKTATDTWYLSGDLKA